MKRLFVACTAVLLSSFGLIASAQDIPADYQQVLTTLGKQGDHSRAVWRTSPPSVAKTLGPSLSGIVMQHVALAGRLFIGGTLKSNCSAPLDG